jgi:hypothetical protein
MVRASCEASPRSTVSYSACASVGSAASEASAAGGAACARAMGQVQRDLMIGRKNQRWLLRNMAFVIVHDETIVKRLPTMLCFD